MGGAAEIEHLPGHHGLPLFGHTLAFLRDPLAFAQGHAERYGPVTRAA